jgi:sulfate adenylyltransferase
MTIIEVGKNIIQDAVNIKNGVYAPLGGFLRACDYKSVLDGMRLQNGDIWSIPIVADIDGMNYRKIKHAKKAVLRHSGTSVELDNIEVYPFDKKELAAAVFGTLDANHPGVAKTL